ncbi:hypothetical protein K439DRAFT_1623296 [Ramaria rubella]|nr:hypothetical protein K439DRAFT_1623296 [Ramaria rubella]
MATTGLATCNVGGTTVHVWAGISLGCGSVDSLVHKVRVCNSGATWAHWLQTWALVIDETVGGTPDVSQSPCSMVIRRSKAPFGGIQLVIAGDFSQLPPIGDNLQFAFEGCEWDRVIKHTYELTKVWRQSHPGFINTLRQIQLGDVTQAGELFIRQLGCWANTRHLAMLPGDVHVYHTVDTEVIQDTDCCRRLLGTLLPESCLALKVGVQVMLIKNGGQALVNGSLGVLLQFDGPVDILPRDSGRVTIGKLRRGFGGEGSQYLIIHFPQPHGGGESQEVQILPEVWKVEAPMGETLVARMQVGGRPFYLLSMSHRAPFAPVALALGLGNLRQQSARPNNQQVACGPA